MANLKAKWHQWRRKSKRIWQIITEGKEQHLSTVSLSVELDVDEFQTNMDIVETRLDSANEKAQELEGRLKRIGEMWIT